MAEKIVILGAGESGTGAAVLAKSKGFDVFVSDAGSIKEKHKNMLIAHHIPFEEKQHSMERIADASEIIKSPGIPDKAPIMQIVKEKKIPVISEIEFAGRYTKAKKICITGSNGKTTTTYLIYYILHSAGLDVGLAGNVGYSFAYQVATGDHEYYVIELSSFQLDNMYAFKADVAVLMNITPDHLDRYNYSFQDYINSKFRITNNMTKNDYFIYFADDDTIQQHLQKQTVEAMHLPFSLSKKEGQAAWLEGNTMHINHQKNIITMTIEELAIKGKHNVCNSMAAGIAARVMDIRKEMIRKCLSDFQGVEHRLERFIKVRGVEFINDSKATNVNSTWYALESMPANKVVWIAGGVDKGNDYAEIESLVREKVKALVCLGKDNSKLFKAFQDRVPIIVETQSMCDAVKRAYQLAQKDDIVLLSPCCASFDLFENYEDRGRQFKECVRNL